MQRNQTRRLEFIYLRAYYVFSLCPPPISFSFKKETLLKNVETPEIFKICFLFDWLQFKNNIMAHFKAEQEQHFKGQKRAIMFALDQGWAT